MLAIDQTVPRIVFVLFYEDKTFAAFPLHTLPQFLSDVCDFFHLPHKELIL
jgi:hypothetical protein